MFDQLQNLRAQLEDRPPPAIDYNGLSSSGKQAAQALVENDEARFKTIEGRTKLVPHSKNVVVQILSLGAHA